MKNIKKLNFEIDTLLKQNLSKNEIISKIIEISLNFEIPIAIVETDNGLIARFYIDASFPAECMLLRK